MLPSDPDFFYFTVNNIIPFDGSDLRYENYCNVCGNYESGDLIKLKNITNPIDDKFYATDIHFGSRNGKSPIIIIGIETYQKIKKEKLRGISFKKVENSISIQEIK